MWKFKTAGPVNGSPAVAGGRTFVAGCDSTLHVLDMANGKELAPWISAARRPPPPRWSATISTSAR